MSDTKKKSQLLGMPFGTANGRLRKMILFMLTQAAEMDTCFRCGKKIASESTLSIEHKKSWQTANEPQATFFDLDNIAFSHLSCNVGGTNREATHCQQGHAFDEENTYVTPGGTRECRTCKRNRIRRFHDAHPGWRKRSCRRERKQQREQKATG